MGKIIGIDLGTTNSLCCPVSVMLSRVSPLWKEPSR